MATNTLGFWNPALYANELLIQLRKNLGLASRVHRGYEAERRAFGKGDTINIRRPATFTAQSAPGAAQDLPTDSVTMTLGNWKEVRVQLSDKEMAYTGQSILTDHVAPAAYALADDIDQALAALVVGVPHVYLEPTAGTAATVSGILNTRKKMVDNRVPLYDMANCHFMVGGKEEADLLALAAFTNESGSGSRGVEAQRVGAIGQRFGFEFFVNQNRTTAAYADITDFAGTITEPGVKGDTSITVGGLGSAEVLKKGVIIKFTTTGNEYAVAADLTLSGGAGLLSISPPLRAAEADNAAITIQTGMDNVTNNLNVAFHKNFAALAMVPLQDFSQYSNNLGVQSFTASDPVTGLSVRSRLHYIGASSALEMVSDVLYGVKLLDGDLACRYEIVNS